MSSSHRLKEKYDKSNRLALHNGDEGSAARTRPFSFEEIMLRRKKKSLSEDVKKGVADEAKLVSKEASVKDISHSNESEGAYRFHKSSSPIAERHVAEEMTKISSRKKERITSMNTKSEEHYLKGKDTGNRELNSKLKARPSSYTSKETEGSRNDKQVHDRREHDKQGSRNDRQIHGRRERDKRLTENTQNEAGKKHSRDSTRKESHADQNRGKSERESKRKYQNGDNEKVKDRNATKKLDTGRHHDTDISGRNKRKEPSKSCFEDPKQRRGRSKSRDREDRNKRSRSPSLGARKRASYNSMVYREAASHHPKDRSEKQHYVDRNRLSSNGLSSHHRRNDGPTSGLGGYSPRKRISEAATKTPSPPNHSSEKKSAKWDLPPAGTDNILSGLVPLNFQSLNSTVSTSVQELAIAAPVASVSREFPSGVFATSLSTKRFASIDSIQLTQSTRPMRRLYVENIPSSTSEKGLVDWLNDLLLSSCVNHIQGTQPCISCIINQDKGQALVEFLTPEDASAALSLDGRSISGSILKIRRPKDFVEVTTGNQEKSVAAVDTITDVVNDSPNKLFIGGISKALSSKMFMEIVSAFGHLKAYHFEVNDNLDEQCAFLEYVDQSVTPKACAGLNGMKLGGKILTVVQAIHGASSLENTGSSSLYEIPELAKPLLKQPTQVLKLKNLFNIEDFSSLSEPQVEEVVEDVRLECARFGNVKSVNVVRHGQCTSETTGTKTSELNNNAQITGPEDKNTEAENLTEHMDDESSGVDAIEFASDVKELDEDKVAEDKCTDDNKPYNISDDNSPQTGQLQSETPIQVLGCVNVTSIIPELPNSQNGPKELSEHHDDKVCSTVLVDADDSENKLKFEDNLNEGDADSRELGNSAELGGSIETESDAVEKDGVKERDFDGSIFEVGCVFVEFGRTEAACIAAHCLNGRVFDDQIVTVEYIALEHYKARFPK
ncbi:Splicing factor-like protein [Parasponia andersonii]|uniref:Splicing factor-like protein n=1 Tax=Parasponia andersonii TaxID=3476 RepID=A0A2P5A9B6_PARAD|nr:Splicing factor-like protein [Parasponia andersonii]